MPSIVLATGSLLLLSCWVVSDSLRPHGLQHSRPPCRSPTPRVYSNSCPLVGDAIQPSHPPSSPFPPAFNLSQIRVFSNKSVLHIRWPKCWCFSSNISPSNEYSGLISFRMDFWISLQSKGLSRVFSNTTVQKHQFFTLSFLYSPTFTSIYDYWKNYNFDWMDLCWQSNVCAF